MYAVNLALGYGFGIKVNTRTKQEADGTGRMKKVTTIVTPAGEFPDGEQIVKAIRKAVNFFGKTPQHKYKLDYFRKAMDMPNISLQNYSKTRVGYVVTTLQSLMENHCILSVGPYDGSNGDFEKVWKKLSETDVASIQEMEAVTKLQNAYTVNESQWSSIFDSFLLP